MEVALLLLKNTRWFSDDGSRSVAVTTTAILEHNAVYWPESACELAYHRAIIARDSFDYSALTNLVGKISAKDSVWKLRKASLLAELGRFDEGRTLIAISHRELQAQYRNDRESIYLLSRLAWAKWLLRHTNLSRFEDIAGALPT